MKTVLFHDDARAEARQSLLWYLKRSESAAFRFSAELQQAYSALTRNPQRFPTYLHGTRRTLLDSYPFFVVFREVPDAIQILAVAHAKRRPGYWQNRT